LAQTWRSPAGPYPWPGFPCHRCREACL